MIGALVSAVVLGGVTVLLGRSAYRTWAHDRADTHRTLAALRWWHLPAAWATLGAVAATYLLLAKLPGLSWGWWSLFGGSGNIIVGQTGRDGLGWETAALLIPVLLAVAVPREALAEEHVFRFGADTQSWTRRLLTCVGFGLGHCILGIPIAAGLAIGLMGGYYLAVYLSAYRRAYAAAERRFAEFEVQAGSHDKPVVLRALARLDASHAAAAAHSVYNWSVLTALIAALLISRF